MVGVHGAVAEEGNRAVKALCEGEVCVFARVFMHGSVFGAGMDGREVATESSFKDGDFLFRR